jgi:hypothetical protein
VAGQPEGSSRCGVSIGEAAGRAFAVRSRSSVAFPTSPCAERLAAGGLGRQASSCRCVGSWVTRAAIRTLDVTTSRGAIRTDGRGSIRGPSCWGPRDCRCRDRLVDPPRRHHAPRSRVVPDWKIRPRKHDAGRLVDWPRSPAGETTLTDGEQMSRLVSHVDPVLVVFAPASLLLPTPELLIVSQAILVSLGAFAVHRLARLKLGSEGLAVLLALATWPTRGSRGRQ